MQIPSLLHCIHVVILLKLNVSFSVTLTMLRFNRITDVALEYVTLKPFFTPQVDSDLWVVPKSHSMDNSQVTNFRIEFPNILSNISLVKSIFY